MEKPGQKLGELDWGLIMEYHLEKLLILTKTYPVPSSNYIEHSCVVAINEQGQLRRLYPVPFRLMESNQKFQKWQWIRAKIARSGDKRPESHNLDVDSIILLEKIGTKGNWAERLVWINDHIIDGMATLDKRRLQTMESLGFIKPQNIQLQISKASPPDWTDKEKANLKKLSLFDSQKSNPRNILRKIPYDFHYQFDCVTENGIETNRHSITDWEMGALYWNCQARYGPKWEVEFRKMFETRFIQKDLLFLMGNMHRLQHIWLIVGLVYPPPAEARQIPLWPLSINV